MQASLFTSVLNIEEFIYHLYKEEDSEGKSEVG